MASIIGYVKKRVLREDYENGKKLPKDWEVARDLGFYTSISTTQIEGERSKTQIEFSASKLDELLEVVRAEYKPAVEAPLLKKLKARQKKAKAQEVLIAELQAEIKSLKQSHASELKDLKKQLAERDAAVLSEIKQRDKAWEDNIYLDQELKQAQADRDHARSEYYEGGRAYENMKACLLWANEQLEKHGILTEDAPSIRSSWGLKDAMPRPFKPHQGGSFSKK
ncbi:hypothetical protein V0R50_25750 [Pseudomonas sp. 148P]|uniref:Uncharacterized protein n=1 Tax=Pseudomonas ulcerans TaxID=3115852 RepID=A0ABU7HYS7_9PSED|nr:MULTISPECIES: hypothetical protein [unclassified Pseudomonas]MEE1925203.1 hypothetical protein [Pseudomonas sp. 147P]MEE1936641.1 hypothetical protein [Pseudomonas sp. 148P]